MLQYLKMYFTLAILSSSPLLSAVELGNNVTGYIGLNGESGFGSATLNGTALPDNSGYFESSVPIGQSFSIHATMRDFQDSFGSDLDHTRSNLGPLAEGEILELDMTKDSGRILGTVNVTGGSLHRIDMKSRVVYGDESYLGNSVGGYETGYTAIQPMPAFNNIKANGFAQVDVSNNTGTCAVTFPLQAKYVDVLSGTDSPIVWDLDTTDTDCTKGDLSGMISLNGPIPWSTRSRFEVSGPDYRYTEPRNDGSYQISGLRIGNYNYGYRNYFISGTARLSAAGGRPIAIDPGVTTTYNISYDLGTVDGVLQLEGPASFNNLRYLNSNWYSAAGGFEAEHGGTQHGPYGYGLGEFKLVGEAGEWTLNSISMTYDTLDIRNDSAPYTRTTISHSPSLAYREVTKIQLMPLSSKTAPDLILKTSESLVGFQLSDQIANQGGVITRLTYAGNSWPDEEDFFNDNPSASFDDFLDIQQQLGGTTIFGQDSNIDTGKPVHFATIKGIPGVYKMSATAYHSLGGIESAEFQLVLSEPVFIDIASDALPQSFTSPTGDTIGTLDFGKVTQAGSTTFSEVTVGPDPEEGFSIFIENQAGDEPQPKYFDISTTVSFAGNVLVCVEYDDTGLSPDEESRLSMGHYTESGWVNITQVDYSNKDSNILCGITSSFSYFAILLSDTPPDTDGDGVYDSVDNCPSTPNPVQEDLDGDGIGSACDADYDGDGFINDVDLCPTVFSSENGDIDEDGIGDPCDPDKDGDGMENDYDNCPTISNATQVDFDDDGYGDACDDDDDADSVADSQDLCPGTSYGAYIAYLDGEDAGCTSGQLIAKNCPVDGDYRNHGAYVHCVSDEAERQILREILSPEDRGTIVSTAAQSDIGKQ